jgi:hypothetical protein
MSASHFLATAILAVPIVALVILNLLPHKKGDDNE